MRIFQPFPLMMIAAMSFLITACPSTSEDSQLTDPVRPVKPQASEEVIYHVFQRSFYDSGQDGHGDFRGLVEKLDYLQELGVTSILMTPLYKSIYYHNYFADDFEEMDPLFGSKEDYLSMIREIHNRGMKFYMDMEVQYVTEDHIWWNDAYGNPDSEYSDFVIWNGPGNTEPESIIFDLPGLEGYDGRYKRITSVNMASPEVLEYMKELFRYWVDPDADGDFSDGVDGYRIDHMMNDLDWKGILPNLFTDFWVPIFDDIRAINPDVRIIAEQAEWGSAGNEYFTDAEVDMMFGFRLREALIEGGKDRVGDVLDTLFNETPEGRYQIAFLENHDTERLATKVSDERKRRAMAACTILSPGTPLIYYGEELGMKGKGGHGLYGSTDGNDIPRREAFEWYADPTGQGMCFWYRDSGPWWEDSEVKAHDGISVEEQQSDSSSTLNLYRDLLALRASSDAFRSADIDVRQHNGEHIIAFERTGSTERFLVAINLSAEEDSADLGLSGELVAGQAKVDAGRVTLPAGSFAVWKL